MGAIDGQGASSASGNVNVTASSSASANGRGLLDIHCSSCGAPARFDIVGHTYTCAYCGSLTGIGEALAEKRGFRKLRRRMLKGQRETFSAASAQCSGCGATVVFPVNEALASCEFCGRALVRGEYLKNAEFPELIIPFRFTAGEARSCLEKWCVENGRKKEAAHVREHLDKLKGYYLPYELVHGPIDCTVSREGAGRSFECSGFLDAAFVNASAQLDNLTLNGMEPFDLAELREFDFGYLAQQKAKVADIDERKLDKRVAQEVVSSYSPAVEQAMETRNVDIDVDTENLLRMPVLLPVYFIRQGNVSAAVNGQTGKVAVRSERERKTLPWWIRPIAATLAVFVVALAIATSLMQGIEGGLVMAGAITLVMGLIFYTAFSDAYGGTKRKTLERKVHTSSTTFMRGAGGALEARAEAIPDYSSEPVFFERLDGVRIPVRIRFTTISRTIKMLALGLAVIFLPVIVAFVLNGFDYHGLDVVGSAVWLCIFAIVVPACWIKIGRIDIYENPSLYRIDEQGRKRKVKTGWGASPVLDKVRRLISPGLVAASIALVIIFAMSVYLVLGGGA